MIRSLGMILQETGQSNCLLAINNDQIVNQSGSVIPVRTEVAEERERVGERERNRSAQFGQRKSVFY